VWPARTRYVLNGRLQASRAAAGSPLAEDNYSDVLWLGSRGMRCDTRFALSLPRCTTWASASPTPLFPA
jgi:hypothetical protein